VSRSLRRTLAVRFAATMAVGLAAASAAIGWGTARVQRQLLDHSLAASAFVYGERLTVATHADLEWDVRPEAYQRDVNRYFTLRDRGGRVLHVDPHFADGPPLDSAALARAAAGERVWSTGMSHGAAMRSLYQRIGEDRILQTSASLTPLHTTTREMALSLAAIVVLGTGVTLIGAGWLAGSAVRPVSEITAQATHIEGGTLDQRIVAHADTEEYVGLVGVLNRMLDRLERAFNAQRRFTADVSHELRTPLTALRGEIEVALRSERAPREYQRVLRSGLEEIERLTRMTEELLLIARAESHILEAHRAPEDVNALMRDIGDRWTSRTADKGLRLTVELDGKLGPVSVDADLLARVADELLENAVKFTPAPGVIQLTTLALPEGGARVTVADSGPGIAPADLPHVFEPFYRADLARTRGDGTGLGLTLCAAVARLHGGRIRAVPNDGQGTRFEVDLPAG
jgi:two-component system OmpR family sensor kinase